MSEKIINNKEYMRTSDLALIVSLSLYFSVEAIDRESSGKAYFLFRKSGDLDDTLQKYWSRQLKIEPQAFFNQLKVIKARIYSE